MPAKAAEMKKKRTRIFHKWLCAACVQAIIECRERERENAIRPRLFVRGSALLLNNIPMPARRKTTARRRFMSKANIGSALDVGS
jgi:hypothetical protein